MKVDYVGILPHETKSYSDATIKTIDGTEIKINGFLSESTIRLVEQEALEAARKKFAIAAQETNLLASVVASDKITF